MVCLKGKKHEKMNDYASFCLNVYFKFYKRGFASGIKSDIFNSKHKAPKSSYKNKILLTIPGVKIQNHSINKNIKIKPFSHFI